MHMHVSKYMEISKLVLPCRVTVQQHILWDFCFDSAAYCSIVNISYFTDCSTTETCEIQGYLAILKDNT